MGKKARKLRSPKYARKASAFRATVERINKDKTTSNATETTNNTTETVAVVQETKEETKPHL